MYAGMARSVALRQRSGTVAVSAAGMFGGGGGFGITPLALFSLAVVVPEPDGHRFLVEEPAAAATQGFRHDRRAALAGPPGASGAVPSACLGRACRRRLASYLGGNWELGAGGARLAVGAQLMSTPAEP